MVLPKETIHLGANPFCCNTKLELEVLQTCGYYVGTKCKKCNQPYSRETEYFATKKQAEKSLKNGTGRRY